MSDDIYRDPSLAVTSVARPGGRMLQLTPQRGDYALLTRAEVSELYTQLAAWLADTKKDAERWRVLK
jgi:hypothetical protein